MKKTSLIIPAYYATKELVDMTVDCVASLYNDELPDEIIVVNDGSPIKAEIPGAINIHRKKNGGYVRAVNDGLGRATGDILIVGNNDLTFHAEWLSELLLPLQKGFHVSTCWTSDQADLIDFTDEIEPDAHFGALFAMKRRVYDELGGFNEKYFGYFSDEDYRMRMLQAGYRIGKNKEMVILHRAKATYETVDTNDDDYHNAEKQFEKEWQ